MRKLLLPIKPKYVDAIIAGTKRVEYRTRIRKDPEVTTALIYRSGDLKNAPVQRRTRPVFLCPTGIGFLCRLQV